MQNEMSRRNFIAASIVMAGMATTILGTRTAFATEKGGDASAHADATTKADADTSTSNAEGITLHRGLAAPHGTACFAQIVAAVNPDGTIAAVNLDEYQFASTDIEGLTPVPNSDTDFGANYPEGMTLISKTDNNEAYSSAMAEHGGATQTWVESMKAIEEYAAGKKPEDLEDVDTVTGATLADTANYLKAIAQVTQDNTLTIAGSNAGSDVAFGRINAAAHGTQAFASAVTLMEGDTIIASSIDEYQFASADIEGILPVPNSDADFGANYPDGMTLISKSLNSDIYSAAMEQEVGSTQPWLTSMEAIENSLTGANINDVEVDTVTGATLVSTPDYLQTAIDAGEQAAKTE